MIGKCFSMFQYISLIKYFAVVKSNVVLIKIMCNGMRKYKREEYKIYEHYDYRLHEIYKHLANRD